MQDERDFDYMPFPDTGFEPSVEEKVQQLLRGLNPQQREAVLHETGPLLILAGAGTGKTRVITARIARLILEQKVQPQEVLAITFTNKAAREMRERIEHYIGPAVNRIWVGTFHSMMARILRRHAELLGFTQRFSILDTDDQVKLLKEVQTELNIGDQMVKPKQVQHSISDMKNHNADPSTYFHRVLPRHLADLTLRIYHRYEERLRANDAMDFDNLLLLAVRLFREHPEVLSFYRQHFQQILVDEYQDTNGVQYNLVLLLSGGHHNLCVVGDDDQSIYSFRGADIRNILSFEKDFPEAKVIKLEQNYRSTGHILNAANAVIANNEARKSKALWTDAGDGRQITWYHLESQREEARNIVRQIYQGVNETHEVRYSDCAILYRINALSRTLEEALREVGIPYVIYGGLRFYDRKEIKDVLAYLRLLANPADGLAFARILNVPRRGIGEVTQKAILDAAEAHNLNFVGVCRQAALIPGLERAARKLEGFAALYDRLSAELQNAPSFAAFVDFLQNETGMVRELEALKQKSPEEGQDRLENLRELISEVVEFEKNPVPPDFLDPESEEEQREWSRRDLLDAFVERSALYASTDNSPETQDCVSLISMHSAKGLEFDWVFLAGLEEGVFPGFRSFDSPQAMEEERRLAYVALTRAKRQLCVYSTRQRLLYGQTTAAKPSRFLKEIPQKHLKLVAAPRSPLQSGGYPEASGGYASRRSEGGLQSRRPEELFGSVTQPRGTKPSRFSAAAGGTETKSAASASAARPSASGSTAASDYLLPSDLSIGMEVVHPRFGRGTVREIVPAGDDAMLLIEFEVGRKRLMTKQAQLKRAN